MTVVMHRDFLRRFLCPPVNEESMFWFLRHAQNHVPANIQSTTSMHGYSGTVNGPVAKLSP
ncbi:MAG: hypothetical protein SGJ02_09550 [bacterium]|nr:hypothetical protein [bacterium]